MGPIEILQAYLDEVTAALLADDWETYRDGVSLPCAMISRDTSMIIADEVALRTIFNAFHAMLKGQGVTQFIRLVDQAYFLDKDMISGYYMSHIFVGGQRVTPPFRSMLDMRLEGNRWRAAAITNGLGKNQLPLEPTVAVEARSVSEGARG